MAAISALAVNGLLRTAKAPTAAARLPGPCAASVDWLAPTSSTCTSGFSARALEGMTAVIVNLNRRYKGHAGVRIVGL